MQNEKINVILIDRQQLFREGVKRVMESNDTFHLIVSSDDYSVVEPLMALQHVDVLIIDAHTFKEHKQQIREDVLDDTDINVIVMDKEGKETFVPEAIRLGVQGYLIKDMDIFTFLDAIKVVHNGMTYIYPTITNELVEDYRKLSQGEPEGKKVQLPLHLYTRRECQVLQLLTDGQSNRQIAETLEISEKTVKNHVSSLFKKMGVNDRTQAVVMAIRNNWVEL